MSTIAQPVSVPLPQPRRVRPANALLTLARRRAMLTSRKPRQVAVPLLGPALAALILAPALKKAIGGLHSHIDYTSYVGATPVLAILPFFFAGAQFPISAMRARSRRSRRSCHLRMRSLRYGFIDPQERGCTTSGR